MSRLNKWKGDVKYVGHIKRQHLQKPYSREKKRRAGGSIDTSENITPRDRWTAVCKSVQLGKETESVGDPL